MENFPSYHSTSNLRPQVLLIIDEMWPISDFRIRFRDDGARGTGSFHVVAVLSSMLRVPH